MFYLLNPTQLKSLCLQYGFFPSKSFGQNYLITPAPLKKIIQAADLNDGDTILEIGPGFGYLTINISPMVKKMVALEIEKSLFPYWEMEKKKLPNLEVIYGDALRLLPQVTDHRSLITDNYKVIANLPYQITSNVLRTLLELENKPESITIMVQKEVAERICSKPGEMSLLSVAVQYYGEPKIVDIVTRGNFWPSPKVDSAILKIEIKKFRNLEISDSDFFKVVRVGFANKRKQLINNLSKGLKIDSNKIKEILKEICGNEKVRAEELSVEEWVKIVKLSTFSCELEKNLL